MNRSDLKTEEASARDVSGDPRGAWDEIPWDEVTRHVNRLQTRIAEAETEGRTEEVRKLQRLLTRSFDAKLLAVRTVTSNRGKNTPGVDGVVWDTPEAKLAAAKSLTGKGYKAKPLRRANIPKKGKPGQTRPLGIPTMYDRAMQALHALALDPIAEVRGDLHSYGFRTGRSAQDASQRLFLLLSQRTSPQWVLEADIRGCFDNISHEFLMKNVPMDKAVMAQFLKAGFVENEQWHATEAGTPQGGIISSIYCNLALDGMERLLDEHFQLTKSGKPSPKAGRNRVHITRYADDFVVSAATPEVAEEVRALLVPFLAERGLELSEEKTLVTNINQGFDFLGWNFRKYDGKLLIKPSKKAVKAFLAETHRLILDAGKGLGQDELISALAPKVRGFASYHRHTCCSETFSRIADIMHRQLTRWACRRHQNKSRKWVLRKYWHPIGSMNWVFGSDGQYLAPITCQHVVRHLPLKTDMNPYIDRAYFAQRRAALKRRASKSFHMPVSQL